MLSPRSLPLIQKNQQHCSNKWCNHCIIVAYCFEVHQQEQGLELISLYVNICEYVKISWSAMAGYVKPQVTSGPQQQPTQLAQPLYQGLLPWGNPLTGNFLKADSFISQPNESVHMQITVEFVLNL